MPSLVRVALAATLLAAPLVAAPAAQAAYPILSESYSVHDHKTKGQNWHVEVEISPDTRLEARTVVVYEQICNATPVMFDARIDLKGRLRFYDEPFKLGKKAGEGRWTMVAQFSSEHELVGEYRVTTPACDTGPRQFTAHAGSHDHEKGTNHHAGTRPGEFPTLATASSTARSQAQKLWRGTLRSAALQFPFYESARELKFRRYPLKWKRPLLFHLRHDGYAADKRMLDPFKPESLVYWWPKRGAPILLGFMFRAPLGDPPPFAGKLLAWHSHVEDGRKGDNQMTHVWLTNDLRSALANCLPVEQLQEANPRFRYSRPSHGAGHESRRCRG